MEGLTISVGILAVLIFVALAFAFMNGFHDGANSISTIVATGVLTPKHAVLFASFFNFAVLWVFQLKVAATIGKGTVDPSFVDYYVIFGALCGAISLGLATLGGIPVSTTHTITGAIAGAGAVHNMKRVRWDISIKLAVAWVLTIPASGLNAAAFWWIGTKVM